MNRVPYLLVMVFVAPPALDFAILPIKAVRIIEVTFGFDRNMLEVLVAFLMLELSDVAQIRMDEGIRLPIIAGKQVVIDLIFGMRLEALEADVTPDNKGLEIPADYMYGLPFLVSVSASCILGTTELAYFLLP